MRCGNDGIVLLSPRYGRLTTIKHQDVMKSENRLFTKQRRELSVSGL